MYNFYNLQFLNLNLGYFFMILNLLESNILIFE